MYTSHYPLTYYFYPLLELDISSHPDAGEFSNSMGRERGNDVETLLYIHIPYCQDLCRFCPFHVRVDKDTSVYERYTQALCKDIENTAKEKRASTSKIGAIYFGGGSPSVLSIEQLDRIFNSVYRHFELTPDVEISFEGEPKTLGNPKLLALLKKHRVDRISFGVQTFDEEVRDLFNIAATLKDIEEVTRAGKEFEFKEINVDMMYNLPGQSLSSLQRDIDISIASGFDSIDYYNLHYYAFPPKFIREMEKGKIPNKPSEQMTFSFFEQLKFSLAQAGLKNVADQVYSKRGKVCEYFRLLWGGGCGEHRAETLAVGASARGYVDGFTYIKNGNANKYMSAIEQGGDAIEKISSRLINGHNRGAVMFPKFLSIDKDKADAIETIPKQLFDEWLNNGLLIEYDDCYQISERGKVWVDNMTVDLFEAAQRQVGDNAVIALSSKAGSRTGSF